MTLITLLAALFLTSAAENFDKNNWSKWKTESYKNHLESKTSFLNAIALSFNTKGKSLYLSPATDALTTRWERTRLPGYHIKATNLGDKVRLVRPGHRDVFLTEAKRRFHWPLKNGLIAEAVYSKTAKKVWGYIYDPEQIKKFTGFRFYPFNEKAIVTANFKRTPKKVVSYKTVQGDLRKVSKIGEVIFNYQDQPFKLNAYNWQKEGEEPNYLALVFTDKMSGKETYAGGREVVIKFNKKEFSQVEKLTLDFNRTSNFYCAHSPFWHCPTGLQQKMNVSVKAGEMLPLKKIVKR